MTIPRNTAVVGALAFVAYNVVLALFIAATIRSPLGGPMRSLLVLVDIAVPLVALVKGWARFAVGWTIGIGVTIIAAAGLCFYALGNMH